MIKLKFHKVFFRMPMDKMPNTEKPLLVPNGSVSYSNRILKYFKCCCVP